MENKKLPAINNEVASKKTVIVKASKRQIEDIKKILNLQSGNEFVKSFIPDVYELSIPIKYRIGPKLLSENSSLSDLYAKKKKRVIDFENSEEFYEKSKGKKSYKIISDEFSDSKNTYLYQGFNYIEVSLRRIIIKNFDANKILTINSKFNTNVKRRGTSDYIISQYELSELLEYYLFARASEDYIIDTWKKSSQKAGDIIPLLELTKLEEFNFPLTRQEVEEIRKARNTCMHFRVISLDDYIKTINLINKYTKGIFRNEIQSKLSSSFAILIEQISLAIEPMQAMNKIIQEQMRPFINVSKIFQEQMKPFVDVNKIIQEQMKPFTGVSKIIQEQMKPFAGINKIIQKQASFTSKEPSKKE